MNIINSSSVKSDMHIFNNQNEESETIWIILSYIIDKKIYIYRKLMNSNKYNYNKL